MKEIPLTQGEVALVSDEDYDYLRQFTWYACRFIDSRTCYAARHSPRVNGKRTRILMHREILRLGAGEQADHIDGDGLNNQRANLRACSNTENQYNRPKLASNTSGYKGVSMHKHAGRWRATMKHNGKHKHIGYFDTAEDAASAYDKVARELQGEFARLNFPDGGW